MKITHKTSPNSYISQGYEKVIEDIDLFYKTFRDTVTKQERLPFCSVDPDVEVIHPTMGTIDRGIVWYEPEYHSEWQSFSDASFSITPNKEIEAVLDIEQASLKVIPVGCWLIDCPRGKIGMKLVSAEHPPDSYITFFDFSDDFSVAQRDVIRLYVESCVIGSYRPDKVDILKQFGTDHISSYPPVYARIIDDLNIDPEMSLDDSKLAPFRDVLALMMALNESMVAYNWALELFKRYFDTIPILAKEYTKYRQEYCYADQCVDDDEYRTLEEGILAFNAYYASGRGTKKLLNRRVAQALGIYSLLGERDPSSFHVNITPDPDDPQLYDLILGAMAESDLDYGDITPFMDDVIKNTIKQRMWDSKTLMPYWEEEFEEPLGSDLPLDVVFRKRLMSLIDKYLVTWR